VTGVHGLGESGRHTRTHHARARVHTHTSVEVGDAGGARQMAARERTGEGTKRSTAGSCTSLRDQSSPQARSSYAYGRMSCEDWVSSLVSYMDTCSDTISSNRTRCSC
jgi:hypothetical protein